MNIYFIHGLLSKPDTPSGTMLDAVTGIPSIKLSYRPDDTYQLGLSKLLTQCTGASSADIFVGESMGGFWAAQLAYMKRAYFYGWNPCITPALQMVQFIGAHEWGTETITITREQVDTFAKAPDPRTWAMSGKVGLAIDYNDTLISAYYTESYYANYTAFKDIVTDGHAMTKPATFKILGSRVLAWIPPEAYDIIHTVKVG